MFKKEKIEWTWWKIVAKGIFCFVQAQQTQKRTPLNIKKRIKFQRSLRPKCILVGRIDGKMHFRVSQTQSVLRGGINNFKSFSKFLPSSISKWKKKKQVGSPRPKCVLRGIINNGNVLSCLLNMIVQFSIGKWKEKAGSLRPSVPLCYMRNCVDKNLRFGDNRSNLEYRTDEYIILIVKHRLQSRTVYVQYSE